METIIKRAEEGGYKNNIVNNWDMFSNDAKEIRFKVFLLDPLFWQALGKACDWEEDTQYDLTVAILFYEKNLTEGYDEAIKWLESILPTPNVSNDM